MALKLPDGPFAAYLFDCDGTVADTMPLHHLAWLAAIQPWGAVFAERDFYGWAGKPTPEIVRLLNEQQKLSMPISEIAHLKEEAYFKYLPQIQPVAEVVACMRELKGKAPFAVVSGSPRDAVIRTLTTLKLLDYFQVLIGAEDYTHGKPAPDPFLLAATRLQVPPRDCLVFEDAELGIQSAEAAGMRWVRVPQSSNPT